MHPMALRLAEAFIRDFWASNRSIKWLGVEQERLIWLSPNTALVGKRDGLGLSADSEPFFGDWKSANAKKKRFIKEEKQRWRMNPQALTYGVLNESDAHHFTVRWVFKPDPKKPDEPITTDFEWYEYSDAELFFWKGELLTIADEIRRLRSSTIPRDLAHWPTNLKQCTKYGEPYKCPFRDGGCWAFNWTHIPEGMTPRTQSHLQIENEIKAQLDSLPMRNDVVVLDASRTSDWLDCSEYYRRMWEGTGLRETNEDLTIGHDMHELIAAHLNQIKKEQEQKTNDATRCIQVD